jgi:hypothetical protein
MSPEAENMNNVLKFVNNSLFGHLKPLPIARKVIWDRRTDPRPYHAYYDSGEERARKAGEEADARFDDLCDLLRSCIRRIQERKIDGSLIDDIEEVQTDLGEMLPKDL